MNGRKGFTLIETLVALVILAILVAIAIPRFSNTIEKVTDSAAVTDLRNAMSAQEAYLIDNQTYTLLSNLALSTSAGVILGGGGSAGGYSLTARYRSSRSTYAVEIGTGTSVEGKIVKQ